MEFIKPILQGGGDHVSKGGSHNTEGGKGGLVFPMSIHNLRAGEHTKLPLGPREGSIFLPELPPEEDVNLRHDLNTLMTDGGVTIMTPLSEQLRRPLPKATVLLSLDDLSAGVHKQLSPGTPLAVSVDADVQEDDLTIIHGVPEVEVVVPDFSLTTLEQDMDPLINRLAELQQFQFLNDLWVIPRFQVPENTSGPDLEKIGHTLISRIPRGSVLMNTSGHSRDLVEYIDVGSYCHFNTNMQKFVTSKKTIFDN